MFSVEFSVMLSLHGGAFLALYKLVSFMRLCQLILKLEELVLFPAMDQNVPAEQQK